ncbi:hypothetical protein LC040_03565 [Bacillus tianshenii]|nr:hypothetical protein LC040_03565 [Bacillus tianshenii]
MNVDAILKKIHRLCERGDYEQAEMLVGRYQKQLSEPEWHEKMESVPQQMLEYIINPKSKHTYKGTFSRSKKKPYVGTYPRKKVRQETELSEREVYQLIKNINRWCNDANWHPVRIEFQENRELFQMEKYRGLLNRSARVLFDSLEKDENEQRA